MKPTEEPRFGNQSQSLSERVSLQPFFHRHVPITQNQRKNRDSVNPALRLVWAFIYRKI